MQLRIDTIIVTHIKQVISFIVGYALQSLQVLLMIFAGGLVLTALVCSLTHTRVNKVY